MFPEPPPAALNQQGGIRSLEGTVVAVYDIVPARAGGRPDARTPKARHLVSNFFAHLRSHPMCPALAEQQDGLKGARSETVRRDMGMGFAP